MIVFLSLGRNIGNRAEHIQLALDLLAQQGINNLQCAPLIKSAALLPQNAQNDWDKEFLNTVAKGETELSPQELLKIIKEIEQKIGRQARGHWGPREIDVDILDYNGQILTSDTLNLPHAQMHLRNFVLKPLMELDPDWQHPILHKTARELLNL